MTKFKTYIVREIYDPETGNYYGRNSANFYVYLKEDVDKVVKE
jgi:hypothetical protein